MSEPSEPVTNDPTLSAMGVPSRAPPAPADALAAIEGTVSRLRAELDGTEDATRRARLLTEIGEIQERAGDEAGAAREYLAAFNTDASFREPLEGLLRLLERRRSLKNLGKLIDAVVRAATTPDERARALLMRSHYLEDVALDPDGAKAAAFEATGVDAPPNEAGAAWLTVEILAAKQGDGVARAEALYERAAYAGDKTWKGLLYLDVARLAVESGEIDRAFEVLRMAEELGAGASYRAATEIERLARKEPGIPGTDEARARAELLASSLGAQATMIEEALRNPEQGRSRGVPEWVKTLPTMADAWLRAAEARRVMGELDRAGGLLQHATEAISWGSWAEGDAQTAALVDAALATARIRIAELTGDTALAATLAAKRLERETDGGVAASLAMRIAEQAASEGDAARALDALARAIEKDPACLAARALQLDLLADGGDMTTFASQLESYADHLGNDEARGRAFLLAAYVWAVFGGDGVGAKAALSQASMFGVPPATTARLARMMAALSSDWAWYEEATRRLVAPGSGAAASPSMGGADESEVVPLYFELVRARYTRGDGDGARKALRELAALPKGAWLARMLEAFLPSPEEVDGDPESTVDAPGRHAALALQELAAGIEPDPENARALTLLGAMRAQAGGDVEAARTMLRELVAKDPKDILTAVLLTELERSMGATGEAAKVAFEAAQAADDPSLASMLFFEAGFLRWRSGDRQGAVDAFEAAGEDARDAADSVLAWALRGLDPGNVDARRRALDKALEAGGDVRVVALERFALEATGGDPDAAREALESLEQKDADEDLALAAALARLAWSPGADQRQAFDRAAERVASRGPVARTIAAAERVRASRAGGDRDELTRATRAWFEDGGGLAAAIEWLAAATAAADAEAERQARLAVASALDGDTRDAMVASATLVALEARDTSTNGDGSDGAPSALPPFVRGESNAVRLANLELAPPGCDPRRRATALAEIDGALGAEAQMDALGLAAWSALAAGDAKAALSAFKQVTSARPEDLAAWEGVRTCAELLEDKGERAAAAAELGARMADDARGAASWEEAALLWLELGDGPRAEEAFERAFRRDGKRFVSFDKLFRRVRERKDGDKMLSLIERRLEFAEEPQEIMKLYWEQARVLREKGDPDGALMALEHVNLIDPDHAGALALTGEIAIRRGRFEEAADALARLSTLEAAPPKNRVTAGVAAVDLYENKLERFDKALNVLIGLHRAKLSSLPVRERLARAAARIGSWKEATMILEELMHERPEAQGRIDAARLAMAIYRDRLNDPQGATAAVVKLLQEAPGDGEALDMLFAITAPVDVRMPLLAAARSALLVQLQKVPTDALTVERLAHIAAALGEADLEQAALSVVLTLNASADVENELTRVSSRKARAPSIAITKAAWRSLLAPGDEGAVADLFVLLGPTLAESLGPALGACGVGKRDRIDPRSGIALRNEIAAWAGALGILEFDLYVGGKDPNAVQGVPGEPPALVVGTGVASPLSPLARARVVRELVGIARGTSIVRHRDEVTIAAVVVAACKLADVAVDHPPYAVLAEVEKAMGRAMPRRTRKALPDICRAIVSRGSDARAWFERAIATQARVMTVAAGDVSIVLSELMGAPRSELREAVRGEPGSEELLRFVLSSGYLELRRAFGLEGTR